MIIADFHIHSKYSRAVSKNMVLEEIDKWALKKGIKIISASDFTHPLWFQELKTKLEEAEPGLYRLKTSVEKETRFILTTEISCIYSKNGKGRRIHILIFAPSLEIAEKINNKLNWTYNLKSDGRPILGLDAKELAKIVFDISSECLIVPAHIWTPWFSLFGSKSGFNTIAECFEELSSRIYAVETGLSSDPRMNWRISELDTKTIISGSDAHSLSHIGREACVFEIEKENLSFAEISRIIREKDSEKFLHTLEFFPEEGMYHFDGHRDCGVSYSPYETKNRNGICEKCGKPVVIGVMNRVMELAAHDRPENFDLAGAIPFKSLVPLYEIISDALNVGVNTKSVLQIYEKLLNDLKSEFNVLLHATYKEIETVSDKKIAEGVIRVREGKINIFPGYDGKYGKVKIFKEGEDFSKEEKQSSLF